MKAKHCVKLSFNGERRNRLLKTSSNQRDRTENTKLFKETKVISQVKHLHPAESHPERWCKESKSAFVSFVFVYACVAVCVGERESQTKITLLFSFLGQYPSTSDFGDTLPLIILVKDTHGNLPRELEPKPVHMHTTDSKVPLPPLGHLPTDLLSLGNVVQSYGTASAPADRCYSFEYHWRSHEQRAEGDGNPSTGVCHPTDPTRGAEDPPRIWTVSHGGTKRMRHLARSVLVSYIWIETFWMYNVCFAKFIIYVE